MDKLIFAVVMLFQVNNNNVIGTASGFFYEHNNRTYLITNRHVVEFSLKNQNPKLYIKLHTDKTNLSKLKTIEIPLVVNKKIIWYAYNNADIAAIPIDSNSISGTIVNAFSKNDFPPKDIELEVGSELIALGYPRGFTDTINMTPIAKTCIISTSLKTGFENRPFFLMDGNLMPGMSGSAIVIKPSSMHMIKNGFSVSKEPISYLIGIHSSSISKTIGEKDEPIYSIENGEIKITGFKKVPINENLGLHSCWHNGLIENLLNQFNK